MRGEGILLDQGWIQDITKGGSRTPRHCVDGEGGDHGDLCIHHIITLQVDLSAIPHCKLEAMTYTLDLD